MMKQHFILYIFLLLTVSASSQDSLATKEISTALYRLNKTRKAAGLDTVSIASTLSKGCYSHAKYLVINRKNPLTAGLNAHKEFSNLKGYTKEGEIAGKSAVIHYVKPSVAITGWIQTFYHRIPLLQPNLKEIGIGFYQKGDDIVSVVDCSAGSKGENLKDVVFYPNENQQDIPLSMGPEIPNPVGQAGDYGFPITLYFTQFQIITNVTFKLTDKDNSIVDCYISTPDHPATAFAQWNCICAIPKKPLLADAQYFVTATCKVNNETFKKTYSFRTIKTP